MKTVLLAFISALVAFNANAASFQYSCAQKAGQFPMDIQMDDRSMTIFNQVEGNGSTRTGNLVFLNAGLKGGSGKMANQLAYKWSKIKSQIYNWNLPQEFLVQPELQTGGVRLNNGRTGGFMSFLGQGFGYEYYLCVRR